MYILEACVENFTAVEKQIALGAQRIELCDNLAVGGTTVSFGVMKQTVDYCRAYDVPVMAMIRPRGGDFVYSETEFRAMIDDIVLARKLGVSGIVLGCLHADNSLQREQMEQLLLLAGDELSVTFHMAFDEMNLEQQYEALDWLIAHHVDRVLTHGGKAGTMIEANIPRLEDLIVYAKKRIIIMPGGGVTQTTLPRLMQQLTTHEFHGTNIV